MAIVPGQRIPIAVRVGYAKAPNAKMVVMSLSGDPITVECNGRSYRSGVDFVLEAVGTDRGSGPAQAGFVGNLTLQDLGDFTEYGYTATQGSESVSGKFRTLPGMDDDFSFYVVTCDASAKLGLSFGAQTHTGHGFYKNIREQVEAGGLPCVGILHLDDHGYVSNREFQDAVTGHGTTGLQLTTLKRYDYCAAYLNNHGLHGDVSNPQPSASAVTTANTAIGTNPDRIWCHQNLALWPQWGDWEFSNDLGFDAPTNNPGIPNAYHATYTGAVGNRDGAGLYAWEKIMKPLQPPSAAVSDVNANLWRLELGPVQIIAPDCITNSTGGVTDYTLATPTPVSAIMGSAQIDDILAAVSSAFPFTFIGLANGIKYLSDTHTEWLSGTQHPIKDHCPAEFTKLFTDDGSLFDSQAGTVLTLHGDYHNGHVYHHVIPGQHTADFYEIGAGTVTGSANHQAANAPDLNGSYNGTTVEALEYEVGGGDYGFNWYFGVRVDVYGSRRCREIVVTLFGTRGNEMWSGKFTDKHGNIKFSESTRVFRVVGTIHS